MDRSISLDDMGILEGTDKSSLMADYLRHYERLFCRFKEEPIDLLEIGIYKGASLRIWSKYFTRARIIGLDIDTSCLQFATDRVIIEIGSQSDPQTLERLRTNYRPSIIIDDGSHHAKDILFTFQEMFSAVQAGGIYVIEDLHFHYHHDEATEALRDAPVLPPDYIFRIAQNLLGGTVEFYTPGDSPSLRRYLFENIDHIEVIRNAAVIVKSSPEDIAQRHIALRHLVAESNIQENWRLLSRKLLLDQGSPELTVEVLRKWIEFKPDDWLDHYQLSAVLGSLGQTEAAVTEARLAVELAVQPAHVAAAQERLKAFTAQT